MTLDEAKTFLDLLHREELRDHAFGDVEVAWLDPESEMIADGYFGSSQSHVGACSGLWRFEGEDADALRHCGKLKKVTRNDAGPQE
jgi:hypothetical protein